jgi:hypothetical protein
MKGKKKVSKKAPVIVVDDRDTGTKILDDLKTLLQKYGCKNVVFAADIDIPDDKQEKGFIGLISCEKFRERTTIREFALSYANVARMYQSAREKILLLKI